MGGGDGPDLLDHSIHPPDVLGSEKRLIGAVIAGRKSVVGLKLAGQEAALEGAVDEDADPAIAAIRQDVFLDASIDEE